MENDNPNTITPLEARARLEAMGFVEEFWDRIMHKGFNGIRYGSHEVRALITIARGVTSEVLGDVYNQMRQLDAENAYSNQERLRNKRK